MSDSKMVVILDRLRRNASLSMYAHFGAASRNARANLWLGMPILVLNVLLGSVFVALVSEEIADLWKWISAILALTGGFLAALQMFFKPQRGSQKHRELANRYLTIDRDGELALAEYRDKIIELPSLVERVKSLNTAYEATNRAASEYPTSTADYTRAKRKQMGKEKASSLDEGSDARD